MQVAVCNKGLLKCPCRFHGPKTCLIFSSSFIFGLCIGFGTISNGRDLFAFYLIYLLFCCGAVYCINNAWGIYLIYLLFCDLFSFLCLIFFFCVLFDLFAFCDLFTFCGAVYCINNAWGDSKAQYGLLPPTVPSPHKSALLNIQK